MLDFQGFLTRISGKLPHNPPHTASMLKDGTSHAACGFAEIVQPGSIPPDPRINLKAPTGVGGERVAVFTLQREQRVDRLLECQREFRRGLRRREAGFDCLAK